MTSNAMTDKVSVFPVSFAQQRLLILDQLYRGSPLYNVATGVRLKGRLDVLGLERSINEIVRRHEALRTTFTVAQGQPVQGRDWRCHSDSGRVVE